MVHGTVRHRLQMLPLHFADALCNEDVIGRYQCAGNCLQVQDMPTRCLFCDLLH